MLDVMSDWGEGVISICNSSFSTLPTILTKVSVFCIIPLLVPIPYCYESV